MIFFLLSQCRIRQIVMGKILNLQLMVQMLMLDMILSTHIGMKNIALQQSFQVRHNPLLMDIIKYATAKGGKILDPFAGSCSLGEAALALGRKAVCIEFNPDVAKAAHERLANLTL